MGVKKNLDLIADNMGSTVETVKQQSQIIDRLITQLEALKRDVLDLKIKVRSLESRQSNAGLP